MPTAIPVKRPFAARATALGLVLACAAFLTAPAPAMASDYDITLEYRAALNGIRLGTGEVDGRLWRDGRYELTGTGGVSGFLGSFFRVRAEGSAEGNARADRPQPARYSGEARGGREDREVMMTFNGDRVAGIDMVPALPADYFDSRVPIEDDHLLGVVDPISAGVIHAPNGLTRDLCERTLPIYTGRQRLDLDLTFKGVRDVHNSREDRYSGRVVVCQVDISPIAGHKPDGRFQRYARDTKSIEVWIGLLGDTGFAVPYRVSFPTPFGEGIVQMSRIKLT